MVAQIKKLRRSEGVTTSLPADLTFSATAVSSFGQFVDDAAFVAAKGSAAADGDAYYNTTLDVVRYYANSWKTLGSGSATGINYITSADAENNSVGDWVGYKNAVASVTPENGTGGSPDSQVVFGSSSSSPIRGTYSFILTKDETNRQGNGRSIPFTIDAADKSRVLTISFDYLADSKFDFGSGTAADPSDVVVYIYDVTNSLLIQPYTYQLNGSGQFSSQFQTSSDSTSYRLIIHIAGTGSTGNNWILRLDNFSVGPKDVAKGPVITDAIAFTPVFNGMTSGIGIEKARYYRIGPQIQVEVEITSTGSASGTVAFRHVLSGLPGAADSSLLGLRPTIGSGTLLTAGSTYPLTVVMDGDDIVFKVAEGSISATIPTADGGVDAGDRLSFIATYPIVGWGSNTVISSQDDGRSIEARAYGTTSTPSMTEETAYYIKFDTEEYDTHSAMSHAATGTTAITNGTTFYTPSAGYFHIDASIYLGSATAWVEGGDDYFVVQLYKNSVLHSEKTVNASMPVASYLMADIHTNIKLNANDTLQIAAYYKTASGTSNPHGMIASNSRNYFAVNKINSSETIAASEVVAARYKISAARNWDGTTPINFDTKTFDTHGAVTTGTWKFTAPISGYYSVSVQLQTEAITMTADNAFNVKLLKNGSTLVCALDAYEQDISGSVGGITITSVNRNVKGTDLVYLTAGEYIHVVGDRIAGSVPTLTSTDGNYNWIAIHRIGGVM